MLMTKKGDTWFYNHVSPFFIINTTYVGRNMIHTFRNKDHDTQNSRIGTYYDCADG